MWSFRRASPSGWSDPGRRGVPVVACKLQHVMIGRRTFVYTSAARWVVEHALKACGPRTRARPHVGETGALRSRGAPGARRAPHGSSPSPDRPRAAGDLLTDRTSGSVRPRDLRMRIAAPNGPVGVPCTCVHGDKLIVGDLVGLDTFALPPSKPEAATQAVNSSYGPGHGHICGELCFIISLVDVLLGPTRATRESEMSVSTASELCAQT